MENKKNVKKYKTLGRSESKLITELSKRKLNIFNVDDVCKILNSNKNYAYQIIHSLKNKEWIKK